ncbi:MAG: LCP family protein [Defluviitaleaceae bacterium]|nr:LCP family protein [Defluviitaleaceae bacterium]
MLRGKAFRVLAIFFACLALILGGTAVALRLLVRPPVVPVIQPNIVHSPLEGGYIDPTPAESPSPWPTCDWDGTEVEPDEAYVPAFKEVEPDPEDALINVDAPVTVAAADEWVRRPEFFTFLIFGHDDGFNTDAIMMAAFDAANRQAYLVSIPRDTRVDVRRSIRRINSAYPAGRISGGGHEGGVDQLKREVQTIIGFRPDFYISIDEAAFVRVIDIIGGVYVTVPFNMRYDDPAQRLHINIPAGHQRLDGRNALHFARYRLGNEQRLTISDHRRMEHHQMLINAIMQELWSPRTITSVPELVRTYRSYVNTDLSAFHLMWFAEQFIRDEIELHSYNLPTTSVRTTSWYEVLMVDETLELINRTINPFTRDITDNMLQIAE